MRLKDEIRTIFQTLLIIIIMLALAFLCALLHGCTQGDVSVPILSSTVYQYDLSVKVNGQQFAGVGVVPKAGTYEMKIESEDSIDLMTISSCHRDVSAQAVISQGWFKQKKGYTYTFVPSHGFEDSGSCLVRLGVYSKDVGGQIGWAILDFEGIDTTLGAQNICNGTSTKVGGVSMCQSKAGLMQAINFDVPVEVALNKIEDRCMGKLSVDSKSWAYTIALGECVYEFRELAQPHRKHRHTTVGYAQTMIRTGQ